MYNGLTEDLSNMDKWKDDRVMDCVFVSYCKTNVLDLLDLRKYRILGSSTQKTQKLDGRKVK